jgi:hypothetical protein
MAPAELWSKPELVDLREALITRQPLAWLRHRRVSQAAS